MSHALYTLLKADEKQVRKICKRELIANGYDVIETDDFIYAPGTVPVLFVAHYDIVHEEPPKFVYNTDGVLSAKHGLGADDRAGIYSILEIIQKHHVSVLFTGGEERGCVGASAFTRSGIKPEVNYIIELDRRGSNDAVYYDCDNKDFEAFITAHGWVTQLGSCSDISVLAPYMGVAAVNLSIGYQNEHHEDETLDTKVMNDNIKRAQELLEGTRFEWIEKKYSRWGYYDDYYSEYRKYYSYDDDKVWFGVDYIENGVISSDVVSGSSLAEAIGTFMLYHPDVSFRDMDIYELDEEDYM